GALNKRLDRTVFGNLAPYFGAHVTGLRLDANPPKIKSVCVPARTNRWIIAQLGMGVPFAGVIEKLEVLLAELEKHAPQTGSISRPPRAMTLVPAIVHATRIVEDGEQTYHLLDSAITRRDKQAIALDPSPM